MVSIILPDPCIDRRSNIENLFQSIQKLLSWWRLPLAIRPAELELSAIRPTDIDVLASDEQVIVPISSLSEMPCELLWELT